MLQPDLKQLPTSTELLDAEDFPADNEEQNFIPNVFSDRPKLGDATHLLAFQEEGCSSWR
jgi:hypothetical protein